MNGIAQINFVTKDLEKVKKYWSLLLGKEPDAEYYNGDFGEQLNYLNGKNVNCTDVKAVKYVFGGTIEDMLTGKVSSDDLFFLAFWQPGENDTPWKEFLETRGEGIMDLEMHVKDRHAVYQMLETEPYHIGMFPDSTFSMLHASDKLLVDLNITQDEDNSAAFESQKNRCSPSSRTGL